MIGVKGVGMTMLAEYFSDKGVEVVGSDTAEKFMTDKALKKAGVKVIEKFDKNNIPRDADLIIYSTAYNAQNNEEVAAVFNPPYPPLEGGQNPPNPLYTKGAIRVLTFAEALAAVFNQKYGIAVVGSHGKTTTTAWLGFVMEKVGLHPSAMVGSFVPQLDGLSLAGKSDYLVVEADEYQNKLKYFNPKAVLLNNIDYDHPDFFPSEEDYKNVFIELIKKIPKSGFLIANFDDPIIRKVASVNCKGRVISYAINDVADYVAYDIEKQGGHQYFKVKFGIGDDIDENTSSGNKSHSVALKATEWLNKGGDLGAFSIILSGKHSISNALAVIAASIELGIELVDIRRYLSEFSGTARRMEIMGEFRGATIIDDYAHHPTEIKATLAGARQIYGDRKIIVVFHPHTFTRTKALLDDFAKSFNDADEVIVLDIYGSAREKQGGVHSRDLVAEIKKQETRNKKQNIQYVPTLKGCEEYLRENIKKGDVVILMGAGDVFRVGEGLISKK